jgi:hypothetical protein
MSRRTVQKHVTATMTALGARTRFQAALLARERGWVGGPSRPDTDLHPARARALADEAHAEALKAFNDAPDSDDKQFLLDLPYYMVERDN